jgi:5-methylcytosine-specific restriction endonuclease McrA
MPLLFHWMTGRRVIRVPNEAQRFIRANHMALTLVANYFLARFLSRLNAVPHLVEKIERVVPKRSSLKAFSVQLRSLGETSCFYCRADLSDLTGAVVDHFIPWAFVYEDRIWNLVPCCQACNAKKSASLPDEAQLARLIALNRRRASKPRKTASLIELEPRETDLKNLYRLAVEEQWPLWES